MSTEEWELAVDAPNQRNEIAAEVAHPNPLEGHRNRHEQRRRVVERALVRSRPRHGGARAKQARDSKFYRVSLDAVQPENGDLRRDNCCLPEGHVGSNR